LESRCAVIPIFSGPYPGSFELWEALELHSLADSGPTSIGRPIFFAKQGLKKPARDRSVAALMEQRVRTRYVKSAKFRNAEQSLVDIS